MKARIIWILFAILVFASSSGKLSPEHPIISWKYQPGMGIRLTSLSANKKYIALVVFKTVGNDPIPVYEGIYFLEPNEGLIWKNRHDRAAKGGITDISVSNFGDVLIGSSIFKWIPYEGFYAAYFVELFDKEGRLLWKKKVSDTSIASVSISPDNRFIGLTWDNNIYLFNRMGGLIWGKRIGGEFTDFNFICISENAFRIAVYESTEKKAYIFNSLGHLLWTKECYSSGGIRLSPNGEYIVISCEVTGELAEILGLKVLLLLDSDGRYIREVDSSRNWYDLSISNNAEVVYVQRDDLGNKGVCLFDSDGRLVGQGWYYKFESPRGEHQIGSPCVDISSDGQVIAVSTGYEIHFLKRVELKKKW